MGLIMEQWKPPPYDDNRNGTIGQAVRPKVEKYREVADEVVVVKKFL